MRQVCDKSYMGHECETCICDMYLTNILYETHIWDMYVTNTYLGHLRGACIGKYITNTYAISFILLQNIVLLTVENPNLNLKSTYI